jgi:hypothetical protein
VALRNSTLLAAVDSHDAVHGGGGIENGAKYAACSNGPLSHQNNFLFITAFLHISGCFSGPNRFFPKRYQSHFDVSTLCSNGSLSHQNNPIFFYCFTAFRIEVDI